MPREPLVSVLVTTYNREKYVGAALASVLAQTFEDFEVVVTDNASSDSTVDVVREWARRDPRIRLFVNDRNLGQFANRNRAASLARGRFLKYHDSDDIMYPHCLAVMVPALLAEPRAGFALSGSRYWPGGPCPMLLTPRMSYQREFLGSGMFMYGPACALFRAEFFREIGGFPEMGVGSDHIFWLRACARTPVLLLPGDLFWYRTHAEQEYRSEAAEREYTLVSREVWRQLSSRDCPLTEEERTWAKRNWAFSVFKAFLRDCSRGKWRLARARLENSGLRLSDWLHSLRLPRRDPFAGTPRNPDGAYECPEWLAKAGALFVQEQ